MTPVSRRRFLGGAAAVTATVIASRDVLAAPPVKKKKQKVIILGAGLAGLAAAYALEKKGHEVLILEARKRTGGRVFSHEMDPKEHLVIELGGEWIGESHERMIALCDELGLELFDNRFASHLLYKGKYSKKGEWSYSPEWQATWNQLMEDYPSFTDKQKRQIDKMDWWRYLVKQGIPQFDLDVRELADSTDFGETIRHVSGFSALAEYAESSEHNEMDFKVKGGNSRFVEKLVERIGPENIKLDHEATRVSYGGKNVVVTCQIGGTSYERFEADQIICTVPTYSLMKIEWTPALPPEKLEALDALQYARIHKTAILFDEKFWGDEDFDLITDLYGHYFYHATKSQGSKKGALIAYVCGDKADVIGRQDEAFRRNVVLETLKPAFGDVSKLVSAGDQAQASYYWGNDQYSKGAYALYDNGQWFGVMPVLQKSVGRLHFAGEYLADWQGFMEGAVVTGEDAADKVG